MTKCVCTSVFLRTQNSAKIKQLVPGLYFLRRQIISNLIGLVSFTILINFKTCLFIHSTLHFNPSLAKIIYYLFVLIIQCLLNIMYKDSPKNIVRKFKSFLYTICDRNS